MFGLFSKKQEKVIPRQLSDILVNDEDAYARLGVRDYTERPSDFLIDLNINPVGEYFSDKALMVKVRGKIAGLKTAIRGEGPKRSLTYNGFILINRDFPVYFNGFSPDTLAEDAKMAETIFNAGLAIPVDLVGRLFRPNRSSIPYQICPYVLQLGDYTFPSPKRVD